MVVEFAVAASKVQNRYLWGGTAGPDFDCSGLVQRAFASTGIWVPRDAYQQEAFAKSIPIADLRTGDMLFFGKSKATHVGICLGLATNGQHEMIMETPLQQFLDPGSTASVVYIHSSSRQNGHGKIAIDLLAKDAGRGPGHNFDQFRGGGRIVHGLTFTC